MGLVEGVQRVARKWGIANRVVKVLPLLSLLAAVAGVLWLACLPMEGQHRNTYISENALMPAQVYSYFRESEWHITRGYREEIKKMVNDDGASDAEIRKTLRSWFTDVGIKAFEHPWSVSHGSESHNGTNVYGILHAPRGDSTEAMVLVAPWTVESGELNAGGVALLAALSRYFKKWSVWSKNIILVIPSDSTFALKAWVDAYHTDMENTAGQIEGAVVLDYPSGHDYVSRVEILYDGLNGQLPNLDLFNTATLIAQHEGLKVVVQNLDVNYGHYSDRLKVFARGILRQLLAGINGRLAGGEAFSGWKIDTITLRGQGTEGPADITTLGRIAELTMRSVNNLLEHFHQSFFFYQLVAPKKFVSIGTYLPGAMLITNSFSVMAIYLLLTATKADYYYSTARPVAVLVLVFLGAVVLGQAGLQVDPAHVNLFILPIGAASYALPSILRLAPPSVHPSSAHHLQAYALIVHGLLLSTLATVNFPLALFIGIATLPLAWVRLGMKRSLAVALLHISSPFTAILGLSVYNSHTQSVPILQALSSTFNGFFWGWRALQVWTLAAVVGIWVPIWAVSLLVASAQPKVPVSHEKKNA